MSVRASDELTRPLAQEQDHLVWSHRWLQETRSRCRLVLLLVYLASDVRECPERWAPALLAFEVREFHGRLRYLYGEVGTLALLLSHLQGTGLIAKDLSRALLSIRLALEVQGQESSLQLLSSGAAPRSFAPTRDSRLSLKMQGQIDSSSGILHLAAVAQAEVAAEACPAASYCLVLIVLKTKAGLWRGQHGHGQIIAYGLLTLLFVLRAA